jgi:polysaccharide biosynthesis protein PslG
MSRSLIALVAVAGVLAGAVAVRVAPATAAAPPEFFGVSPQAPVDERDFAMMATDNVGGIRGVISWPSVETSPGTYHWGEVDRSFALAASAGIRMFPVLYGAPKWAMSPSRYRQCGITCGPSAPRAREAFARFAAAAAARYGPGGAFWQETATQPPPSGGAIPYLPVTAWQVWNEQNSPKYFGPRPHVRGYARLLKTTARRIGAVDPNADVVIGGMWGPRSANAVIPTETYLEDLYRVDGVRAAADSIAVHPYAGELEQVKTQLRGIRVVAQRAGDRGVGLWVTELGWASGGPRKQPLVKTPREQATLLRDAFEFLLLKRTAWHIRGVFWYSWRDTRASAGICEWCPRSGLRQIGGGAKPAARAFRRIAAR